MHTYSVFIKYEGPNLLVFSETIHAIAHSFYVGSNNVY